MKAVSLMFKAINSQGSKEAAREKAIQIAEKLKAMRLEKAVQKVEDRIEENLTHMDFPCSALDMDADKQHHWAFQPWD